MRKRYARGLCAVPAAVLAAVWGVTPVLAAATWTVRPGGPVSMKSGRFVLKDTTTGTALCPTGGTSTIIMGCQAASSVTP